jgi:hypothetical protein
MSKLDMDEKVSEMLAKVKLQREEFEKLEKIIPKIGLLTQHLNMEIQQL